MEGKRIVFSTGTPNDQGGIIPNETIDFSRYKANPVVLCQHQWEQPPLGIMTDIKLEGGKYSGIPVFHGITKESQEYRDMYEAGHLRACSIGGEASWKKNSAGQPDLSKDGFRQCEKFMLYEISMVSLPSNPDAVTTLEAKIYEQNELSNISDTITNLSSRYKIPSMETKEKETPEQLKLKAANEKLAAAQAEKEEAEKALLSGKISETDPSASQLPGVIKDIVKNFTSTISDMFNGKQNETHLKVDTQKVKNGTPVKASTPPQDEASDQWISELRDPVEDAQPTPIGLAAEEAKKKAQEAQEKAEKAKEKAEKSDATEEDKAAYKMACHEMEAAMKACEEAEDMAKKEKEKSKESSSKNGSKLAAKKPEPAKIKSMEELRAGAEKLKLAPDPDLRKSLDARVIGLKGDTFSKLSSPKNEEGQRILGRVMTIDGGDKTISDYATVLDSIMRDGKYAAITEKLRVIPNISEGQLSSFQRSTDGTNPKNRVGLGVKDIMRELMTGSVEVMGRDNIRRQMTTLTSTDNALASPALNTIEWLPLAIFNLFPTTSWKNDVPMFGAQITSKNTGLIWANIAAAPTIYKGTQPSPADYTYTDTAVALSLTPYWLQPILWTPLTMHQYRYDQMATGWAQAFALWGSIMDDELLYTLASTVPASSIVKTVGQPANPSFNIANTNDPNAFYWNTAFAGNLATPAYADIIKLEQIYNRQNFQMEKEKSVLVLDPTMYSYISQDNDTKSLLTRWIESDQADLLKIKHTVLHQRSRVALYDPASSAVKDPLGSIPNTAVSAGLAMLPSQVAIGLGLLDVFMVQVPGSYGYRMSADIRIGIVPLRANYNGVLLYTYGTPNV